MDDMRGRVQEIMRLNDRGTFIRTAATAIEFLNREKETA